MALLDAVGVQPIIGLQEWQSHVDLIICDLWGVVHDGISKHDAAEKALLQARQAGITTVFLSNAPRPRDYVRDFLRSIGVSRDLLDFVVTSGGLARDAVREQYQGARLYHLGPKSDGNTVEGLDVQLVEVPEKADVILATGLMFERVEDHRNLLQNAARKKIPFLCANPDRVVHVGDKLLLCAGTIADIYAELGGPVIWHGKPTAESLLACLPAASLDAKELPLERIAMIGDSLQTDIAGAKAAGVRSILVGGGIHRDHMLGVQTYIDDLKAIPEDIFANVFGHGKPVPDVLINQLKW